MRDWFLQQCRHVQGWSMTMATCRGSQERIGHLIQTWGAGPFWSPTPPLISLISLLCLLHFLVPVTRPMLQKVGNNNTVPKIPISSYHMSFIPSTRDENYAFNPRRKKKADTTPLSPGKWYLFMFQSYRCRTNMDGRKSLGRGFQLGRSGLT